MSRDQAVPAKLSPYLEGFFSGAILGAWFVACIGAVVYNDGRWLAAAILILAAGGGIERVRRWRRGGDRKAVKATTIDDHGREGRVR